MTQRNQKAALLSEFVQKGQWFVSQIDLLNRLNGSVEKGGAIGQKVVGFPRSVQVATGVGLLSTSIAVIAFPFPKSLNAPVIGASTFFLAAALVPASIDEKRRKQDANLKIFIEDCENNLLLAEARGDKYLVTDYRDRIAEANRARLSLLVPDSTLLASRLRDTQGKNFYGSINLVKSAINPTEQVIEKPPEDY